MKTFLNTLAIVAFVAFAAYGVGTATNKLLGYDTPPTVIKRVHIHTTTGCSV